MTKLEVLLLLFVSMLFTACGGNDGSDEDHGSSVTYKVHDNNIVGVWKNGDKFVSFSAEKYNSALLTNTFIDEGDYKINGDTIYVYNNYFNKTTKYIVNSLTSNSLSVTVTYKDNWSGEKTQSLQFTKTSENPCSKNHNLVGKSFYAQYNTNSGSQHWNKEFTTYNSISCTRTDVAKSTPSTFYYVYNSPKIYFYVIRSGEFYYDTVRYGEVKFNESNQIESLGYLYGEKLY